MDTNKKMAISLLLMLFVSCFFGCGPREYETTRAVVYQTKSYHLGKTFYKLQVYYMFEYEGDTIKSDFKHPRIYRYRARNIINPGDSVRVQFPPGKPEKNKVISYITMSPQKPAPIFHYGHATPDSARTIYRDSIRVFYRDGTTKLIHLDRKADK